MAEFAGLALELGALTGLDCEPQPERRIGGGSIHACYAWRCASGRLFVKVAPGADLAAFTAEAEGLAELAAVRALRVPRVLGCGAAGAHACLALEWLERGPTDERCETALGEGLAALHAVTATRYGFTHDNFIGRTPQQNAWDTDWARFFAERRLKPQLSLAVANGFGAALEGDGERLLAGVGSLLGTHRPAASLLHGDLWGGNWLASRDGEPAIFDPAVYYGDRETDLAMTRLFGGFGAGFYRAYAAAAPLPPGAALRGELYNLYHLLNHANLFGGGYVADARRATLRLLAELHG
jgi:protein-ribulosamine 3-kinase